jgi:hypothetical protein
MNEEKQRIAIAEACGWTACRIGGAGAGGCVDRPGRPIGTPPKRKYICELPDYLNDLNAMHEAEKHLQHYGVFADQLAIVMKQPRQSILLIHATAAQRAEALLRTLGKWEEA